MIAIIVRIIEIFSIALLGFIAGKFKLVDESCDKPLMNLLINIISPFMILNAINAKALPSGSQKTILFTFLISILFLAFMFIMARVFCVNIFHIPAGEGAGVLMMCFSTSNATIMALPISQALFGDGVMTLLMPVAILINGYFYSAGVVQVNYGTDSNISSKSVLKSISNPCTITMVVSLILLVCNVEIPTICSDIFEMIGSITMPLSMLLLGIQLSRSSLERFFRNKRIIKLSLVKLFIIPIITFLALNFLPIENEIKIGMIFLTSFPSAVAVVPVAGSEGRDALLAAEMISFTSLLSIITIPLTAIILNAIYL